MCNLIISEIPYAIAQANDRGPLDLCATGGGRDPNRLSMQRTAYAAHCHCRVPLHDYHPYY